MLGEVLDNDEQNLMRSGAGRVIDERDGEDVERQERLLTGGGLGHESEAERKRERGRAAAPGDG
jgi:hypothetical protein